MLPIRPRLSACFVAAFALAFALPAAALPGNGRLQIIHLDVGQGDGAAIISPLGQVVLIDEGPDNEFPAMGVSVVGQLQALGITHVDYHFASHYHSDHIGNMNEIVNAGITIGYGWDRGESYFTQAYTNYVNALGSKRRTLVKNQVILLDSLSAHPVSIKVVDLNAAGVPTSDENEQCLVLKVSYGDFDQVFGGDLVGSTSSGGNDIESLVAAAVGPVEVYKVHHHGSRHSSNTNWLNAISPEIAVISCGNGNEYGHPTSDAVNRLHTAGVKTWWTETGTGAVPLAGWDCAVNGQVIISATWEAGGVDSVRGTTGCASTFVNSGGADLTPPVVTLNAPNGGQDWKAGSQRGITWTATDNVGVTSVDLAYSTDGGGTFPNAIISGISNLGSYSWQVPNALGTNLRVRVTAHDAAANSGSDASNANFTISTWTIVASAGPNGSISPSGTVPVLQNSSPVFTIGANPGFAVADVLVNGVSVGAVTSHTFTFVSANHTIAATFEDGAAPTVLIASPNGGESLDQGSLCTISWSAQDNFAVNSVDVDYSLAGVAGPWMPVVHGLTNGSSTQWTVPSQTTDSALVRVTAYDPALNQGSDMSDATFRIVVPAVAVGDRTAVLSLAPPSPNPSHDFALLRFSLPAAGAARLEVLDVSGRRVWGSGEYLPAGSHTLRWDGVESGGQRAGAGLYFVRLVTAWGTRSERFVLMR